MSSQKLTTALSCILVLMMQLGFAKSDFNQERAECADQLVGLAPCLPYVSGAANSPPSDCCSGLKQVLNKSMKCLCILIKERNNPNLGLKVNATLAATLPSSCHAPVNVTDCINLLHLPLNSPEAKEFQTFANITKGANSPVPGASGNSTSSRSSASEKSVGDQRAKRWLLAEMFCGFLLWAFVSLRI